MENTSKENCAVHLYNKAFRSYMFIYIFLSEKKLRSSFNILFIYAMFHIMLYAIFSMFIVIFILYMLAIAQNQKL